MNKKIYVIILAISLIILIVGLIIIFYITQSSKNSTIADSSGFGIINELDGPVPLIDVKRIIDDYTQNSSIDNYINSYIDEKENAIIVTLKDNSIINQDEFIHEVFSNTTGSKYIQNIKKYSSIKFGKEQE